MGDSRETMDKRSLTERDICTKFITPAVKQRRLGRDDADARGGLFHQGPDHRSRQAGHARQGEAGRLHPLLQAEHPDRADRGQGQQPQRRRRHAAGPRVRRDARHPLRLLLERRRLRVPRPHRRRAPRSKRTSASTPSRRPPICGRAIAPGRASTPEAEADRPSGLFRRRQRQGPALLSGQRRQRRDRGHRQGPGPRAAGHGDRHRQDLHRLSDHLAAVEGGPQEAHPVPRRPQRADRPDDGERLPPVRPGDGEAHRPTPRPSSGRTAPRSI